MAKTTDNPTPGAAAANTEPTTPPPAEAKPEPKAAEKRKPGPGEVGWVDETPTMSVTCDHDGYAPSAGVMMKKGSHPYSYPEAAALVANNCGRVSKAERETLEAAGLLKPVTK